MRRLTLSVLLSVTVIGCSDSSRSGGSAKPNPNQQRSGSNRLDKEAEAVLAEIVRSGGGVIRNKSDPNGPITQIQIVNDEFQDQQLKSLQKLNLQSVLISSKSITDLGLKQLEGHRTLTFVSLSCPSVTDLGMKSLAKIPLLNRAQLYSCAKITVDGLLELKRVQFLNLHGSNITDSMLAGLNQFDQLSGLQLSSDQMTDQSLDALRGKLRLKELELVDCPKLTGEVIGKIVAIPNLTKLRMIGHDTTDAGLMRLKELPILVELEIGPAVLQFEGLQITDDGIESLRQCANLAHLRLIHCPQLTDRSLQILAGIKSLKSIKLEKADFSDGAIASLRNALPNAEVEYKALPREFPKALEKLVQEIRKRGGQIVGPVVSTRPVRILSLGSQFDDQDVRSILAFGPIESLYLQGAQFTDAALAAIAELPSVETLNLVACSVTEAGLKQLSKLPLQSLAFHEMEVTDAMLESCGSIGTLQIVMFRKCRTSTASFLTHLSSETLVGVGLGEMEIDEAGLAGLQKCPKLTELSLTDVTNSQSALKAMASLTNLINLHIEKCDLPEGLLGELSKLENLRSLALTEVELTAKQLSDAGSVSSDSSVKSAIPLKQITNLSIKSSEVPEAFLDYLTKFDNLQSLELIDIELTDKEVEQIVRSTSISELTVKACSDVTDAGLMALTKMKSLKSVVLAGEKFSKPGVVEFKTARPDVHVDFQFFEIRDEVK